MKRLIPLLFLSVCGGGVAGAQTPTQNPQTVDPATQRLAGVAAGRGVLNPGQPSAVTASGRGTQAARAPLDAKIAADDRRMGELFNYKLAQGNARILAIRPALGG